MSTIQEDIKLIVGGHFSPDSLGPDVYNQVVARARGDADGYVSVFETEYMGANFDAQAQSRLYLPTFLLLVRNAAPERTQKAATRLLKLYDSVMVIYDSASDKASLFKLLPEETVRQTQRLDARRRELREVLSAK